MSDFEKFYDDLLDLVSRHEKDNTPLKVEKDLQYGIIKIFGDSATSLARAKNGLNDITELAYATAEHHPFWNILYHCSEISNTVLEKWRDDLTEADIDDIRWSIAKLTHGLQRLNEKLS